MAGYIGKNIQVASTSSTAEGRALMGAQSVAEQRTLLSVDSITSVDAKDAALQTTLEAYSDGNSIGVGQTWQDVTASRSVGVTYTNTTGKPIEVLFEGYASGASETTNNFLINGVGIHIIYGDLGHADRTMISVVIPNGSTYSIENTGGIVTIQSWSELR